MVKSSVFRKIVMNVSFTIVIGVSLLFDDSILLPRLIALLVRALAASALFASVTLASIIHDYYPKKHDKPEDFPSLIQEGPYSLCRHPFYFLLVALQICVAVYFLSYQALISSILVLPLWFGLIRVEEKDLLERFGDGYENYRRKTRLILPLKKSRRE